MLCGPTEMNSLTPSPPPPPPIPPVPLKAHGALHSLDHSESNIRHCKDVFFGPSLTFRNSGALVENVRNSDTELRQNHINSQSIPGFPCPAIRQSRPL